ncbi:L-allo-threonine aldolase [Phytophthora citrophthora]|uniref:L-allo-threonine aldolase n=1 Tax=Phytophthora citrophthora TaxID=4793 RepID=A0AAD9H074_9STRA|nr:L-allo-threonine aldolase [Phytophthora citrophthora]
MTKMARAVVNFLSDTVTCPNATMRQAIATAKVGDAVFGADPSVNLLEKVAAERLGKAAALYVPSYGKRLPIEHKWILSLTSCMFVFL